MKKRGEEQKKMINRGGGMSTKIVQGGIGQKDGIRKRLEAQKGL